VRQVGPYKKGVTTVGERAADIVVVLKTLPTKEAVEAVAKKVCELLEQKEPNDGKLFQFRF